MGLALQIVGLLITLAALVLCVKALVGGQTTVIAVVLVLIGGSLIRLGRKIYNKNKKS